MFGKIKRFFYRPADEEIFNEKDGSLYLRRWFIVKTDNFNIYLHNFRSSDEDRALHDHPWWSIGMILWGRYKEHMPKNHKKWVEEGDREETIKLRWPFQPVFRRSNSIHRVELLEVPYERDFPSTPVTKQEKPVWTLFITGPKSRPWGFWCPQGFVKDKEFFKKGCD